MKQNRGGISFSIIGMVLLLLFVGWIIWLDATSIDEEDIPAKKQVIKQEVKTSAKSATNSNSQVKNYTISGNNFSFSQKEIRIKKGDKVTITFSNKEGRHNLAIDGYNTKTNVITENNTASVQFIADKVGTFEYFCEVGDHRIKGMKGILVVENV